MNKKIIATLTVAFMALTIVPGSSAADTGVKTELQLDCAALLHIAATSSSSAGCVPAPPPGCTTVFVGAEGSTAGAYVSDMYNNAPSPANIVSAHLALTFGTVSNAGAFVTCAV